MLFKKDYEGTGSEKVNKTQITTNNFFYCLELLTKPWKTELIPIKGEEILLLFSNLKVFKIFFFSSSWPRIWNELEAVLIHHDWNLHFNLRYNYKFLFSALENGDIDKKKF